MLHAKLKNVVERDIKNIFISCKECSAWELTFNVIFSAAWITSARMRNWACNQQLQVVTRNVWLAVPTLLVTIQLCDYTFHAKLKNVVGIDI